MKWPAFLSRKYGRAAFVTMIVPKRFVSICARKSDIGVSSTDERLPYPALLITTSSEPKAPIAAFTALAAADSSVTSSAKSLIWSPWRSDRSCRDSISLAVANTLFPAARPASTIARPRPRELPVTNQTCAIHPPIIRNRFLRRTHAKKSHRQTGLRSPAAPSHLTPKSFPCPAGYQGGACLQWQLDCPDHEWRIPLSHVIRDN